MVSDTGQLICCPRCLARDIRASHRPKWWDLVMTFLLAAPLRCRVCGKRFYRRLSPAQSRSSSVHS
jgi:hypothetical protein